MSLKAYRTAVVGAITTAFPGFDVARHGGRFTIESLKAFTVRAPAIRVSVMGLGRIVNRPDGRKLVPVTGAAFVVTRDTVAATRDDQMLDALDRLIELIDGQQIFTPTDDLGLQLANITAAQNLYDADTQGLAVALWAVSWSQNVLMGQQVSEFDDPFPLGPDVTGEFELDTILAREGGDVTVIYGGDE